MGKAESVILRTDLSGHPAVMAWLALRPESRLPEEIVVIKGSVCRLNGVGPNSSIVIAKRLSKNSAQVQRIVYEEILPRLPLRTLGYYGAVETSDDEWWIFLEDAAGSPYSRPNQEHREIAARWLGVLHTSAARVDATSRLPHSGPDHYREHLRSGRATIQTAIADPSISLENKDVLQKLVLQQNFLEERWVDMQNFCEKVPRTLVHNDLQAKNVRVRIEDSGSYLMVFDWEIAGYGVPVADLEQLLQPGQDHGLDSALRVYWSQVHEAWSHLRLEDIEHLAKIGKIFRLLMAIHWESLSLDSHWDKAVRRLVKYQSRLEDVIREV